MEQYNVTGMSCAACSARVEKAVSHVPGVTSCSVSLLTNSMGVEGTASPAEIIAAVEEAGYGASEKGTAHEAGRAGGMSIADAEGSLNAENETPADRVPVLSHPAYVFFNGPYDVELAGSFIPGGKPCGHGADPAPSDDDCHGDQSEVFHQRI